MGQLGSGKLGSEASGSGPSPFKQGPLVCELRVKRASAKRPAQHPPRRHWLQATPLVATATGVLRPSGGEEKANDDAAPVAELDDEAPQLGELPGWPGLSTTATLGRSKFLQPL